MSGDDDTRTSGRIGRRRFVAAAGAAGIAGLAGCSGSGGSGGGDGGEMTEGGDGGEMTEGGDGGSSGTPSSSTVTLRVWSGNMTDEPANKRYWENMASRANDQFDDIEIELRGVPYEGQFQKIRSAVQAGPDSAPHIVEMSSRKDTMLAAEPLQIQDMYEGSAVQEALSSGVSELNQGWGQQRTGTEGAIVSIPGGLRPYLNIYRKNWIEAAGLSLDDVGGLTWEDKISNVYEPMKQSDKFDPSNNSFPDTTGMKEGDEEFLSHYSGQWGISKYGTLNDAATRSVLDTEEFRDLLRFQVDNIENQNFHSNSINHGDEEATTLIWNDQLGTIHVQDVSDLWSSFRSELGADNYEQNWHWTTPNAKETKSTFALVPILVPFAEAYTSQAERDAFMKFVNWFSASENEPSRRVREVGWVPPNPSALNSDWFTSTSLHEKFWGTVKQTLEEYQITEQAAVQGASRINFEIPRQMHQRILQQGVSIEEATRIAAEEQNAILRENGRYEPR